MSRITLTEQGVEFLEEYQNEDGETYFEGDLTVEYDYQPYEKPERGSGYSLGYPGCTESVSITAVFANIDGEEVDITDWLEKYEFEKLEEKVLEEVSEQDSYCADWLEEDWRD